ncbi:ORF6N domain-containing protein [Delftia acidovorans]|uniref:ORF6N domain-containing protein n=1 Tax=Delftia acidovorans TaxID=80866 RepID=UPI000F4D2717|nr:ORF6N domain-containing protein [Delftia acidovorans]ROR02112.1 ORF6N domain-containing protein [Delftia acidovorans]
MTELVTIAGVKTPRVTYKDRPVCTTLQLAQFYGCADRNLTDNYQRNSERFEEGKHFVKLDGEALRAFKAHYPANSGVVAERAPHLVLWTELGAARHAKMLTTDKAWEVFEEMEGAYFRAKAAATLEQPSKPARASVRYREAAAITGAQLKICKLLGVDAGMAKVIAAKEVKAVTGLDYTNLLTTTAATDNPRMTPKELAALIGAGATSEQVNSALEQMSFQSKERWTNGKGQPRSKWVLTELGKEYGALVPYQAVEHQHSGYRPA